VLIYGNDTVFINVLCYINSRWYMQLALGVKGWRFYTLGSAVRGKGTYNEGTEREQGCGSTHSPNRRQMEVGVQRRVPAALRYTLRKKTPGIIELI
jgi:hypothetical protein